MQSLTKIIVLAALAGVLTFGALSVAILEPESAELTPRPVPQEVHQRSV